MARLVQITSTITEFSLLTTSLLLEHIEQIKRKHGECCQRRWQPVTRNGPERRGTLYVSWFDVFDDGMILTAADHIDGSDEFPP